jgi:hypothetical protein
MIKREEAWKRRGSEKDATVREHVSVVTPVAGKVSPWGKAGGFHKNSPLERGTRDVLTTMEGFEAQLRVTVPISAADSPLTCQDSSIFGGGLPGEKERKVKPLPSMSRFLEEFTWIRRGVGMKRNGAP